MIPTDSEFTMLYLLYGIVFLLIVLGLFVTQKREYYIHLFVFIIYTSLMIYIFSDKENFKGGGSLVVLFYGILFPIVHLCIYGIIQIIQAIVKKRAKKTV
jgi:hypothetical protein